MSTSHVVLGIEGPIATVTLNRPARLNALSAEMTHGTIDILQSLRDNPAVRVVIITGAGRGFCAGGDLQGIADTLATAAGSDGLVDLLRARAHLVEVISSMPQVTIAAVNGPCAGAGVAIACATNLRFCADTAIWNTAFLETGLSGDFGIAWLMTRLIGRSNTEDLLLRPRRIPPGRLHQIGLVNEVFAAETFLVEVVREAHEIASRGSIPTALMLDNLADAADPQLDLMHYLDVETRRQVTAGLARRQDRTPEPQGAHHG